jgi:GT2 family glycosyltransferase
MTTRTVMSRAAGGDPDSGLPVGKGGHVNPHDQIRELELLLDRQACRIARCEHTLTLVHSSTAYQTLVRLDLDRLWMRCNQATSRVLPHGTRRRAIVRTVFRSMLRMILAVTERRRRSSSPLQPVTPDADYERWIAQVEPDATELEAQRARNFDFEPTISLCLSVADVDGVAFERSLVSVLGQTYPHWELCIVRTEACRIPEAAIADPRVRSARVAAGCSQAARWNTALQMTSGDFVAWIEPSDLLSPGALYEIVRAVNAHPHADILYSDEDQLRENGRDRSAPLFKPDWSPDLLRSTNYLGRLLVLRADLLQRLGGFREGFVGAEEYDLALRATESAREIVHIPRVLYHRGIREQQLLLARKNRASDPSKRALNEHLQRQGTPGEVRDGRIQGTFDVTYPRAHRPLVSIIIPNRDEPEVLARCLQSLWTSTYRRVEVLIVENGSRQPETFNLYDRLEADRRVRILHWDREFNYSAVNNWAAAQAGGEVLLLLNNDIEAINPDWLERMLDHALRPEVGAVGAKLYFSDGTIQHAGVIIGVGPVAGHSHRFVAGASPGYANRLAVVQNLSAVTAACLMVRNEVFHSIAGLDEEFPLALNDVDFCLRLRKAGYRIVWTPFAELYHHESRTRGRDDTPAKQARALHEITRFYRRWHKLLMTGDPFYNPNLTSSLEDFSLRVPDATVSRAA